MVFIKLGEEKRRNSVDYLNLSCDLAKQVDEIYTYT